jgi:hypothetical protein
MPTHRIVNNKSTNNPERKWRKKLRYAKTTKDKEYAQMMLDAIVKKEKPININSKPTDEQLFNEAKKYNRLHKNLNNVSKEREEKQIALKLNRDKILAEKKEKKEKEQRKSSLIGEYNISIENEFKEYRLKNDSEIKQRVKDYMDSNNLCESKAQGIILKAIKDQIIIQQKMIYEIMVECNIDYETAKENLLKQLQLFETMSLTN